MTMTLQEQAWQSGLVLLNETADWNQNDWPPLKGGWRYNHATVVLDHPDTENNNNNNINQGQTVIVLGGFKEDFTITNSVLLLNLANSNMQWREGTPMNKIRREHAAVVCNGGVYVMGGFLGGALDCMERIDSNDLLQSFSTTRSSKKSHWTTLSLRLLRGRDGCCAVAVHNRYIVVMGGQTNIRGENLSSVDIIDTRNHTLTAAPSMNVPRSSFASAVIGHRIFVVGGHNNDGNLDSVEYLDFVNHCDKEETNEDTAAAVISFSSTWTTHSNLALSVPPRYSCAAVAVGSCLVVAGRDSQTVQVLDTNRNRVWNLPPFANHRIGCSMVTLANQIALIGGIMNSTCATLPLMDKNTWCFRRLCEQPPNGWYHGREGSGSRDANGMGIRDTNVRRCLISTLGRK